MVFDLSYSDKRQPSHYSGLKTVLYFHQYCTFLYSVIGLTKLSNFPIHLYLIEAYRIHIISSIFPSKIHFSSPQMKRERLLFSFEVSPLLSTRPRSYYSTSVRLYHSPPLIEKFVFCFCFGVVSPYTPSTHKSSYHSHHS